ncbi:MAG: amidase [Chloroflexi bacterium]|nr:amidase [Chloroflexota bacterium]MYF81453.1 amidase [Chloroflexota bacterium]MYI05268.1 amidase [Chloroflexota bacterium]
MVDNFSSLTEIARAIREREVSASEMLEAHLARIDEVNPTLNAVVALCSERARSEATTADAAIARGDALGPLHGVPITLKDSHDTEGLVTTGGTLGRKEFVPEADSTVAARLRAAGAILMGKTNTPELTLSGETDNLVYGQTRNPFNPERTPGGSSGGAAAIVSAGGSPLDMGSDTGGSIRLPSHFSGICGIKPTAGRVPRTGHIVSWEMGALEAWTTIGPMCRYVEDLELALPIISGPDGVDPFIHPVPLRDSADVDLSGLHIAWYADVDGYLAPDDDTRAVLDAAVTALAERVGSVAHDTPPPLAEYVDLWPRVGGGDGRGWVKRLLDKWGTTEESEFLRKGFDRIEPTDTDVFTESLEYQDRFRSEMLQFIQPYDAIVAPVAARPAPEHGNTYSQELRTMFYTGPYNIAGWPGTALRCGTSGDGLPIGIQVLAHPWREDVTLALARALEQDLGGWQRPPI